MWIYSLGRTLMKTMPAILPPENDEKNMQQQHHSSIVLQATIWKMCKCVDERASLMFLLNVSAYSNFQVLPFPKYSTHHENAESVYMCVVLVMNVRVEKKVKQFFKVWNVKGCKLLHHPRLLIKSSFLSTLSRLYRNSTYSCREVFLFSYSRFYCGYG